MVFPKQRTRGRIYIGRFRFKIRMSFRISTVLEIGFGFRFRVRFLVIIGFRIRVRIRVGFRVRYGIRFDISHPFFRIHVIILPTLFVVEPDPRINGLVGPAPLVCLMPVPNRIQGFGVRIDPAVMHVIKPTR